MQLQNSLESGKRFYVLDSFRGIAAVCVVLVHLHFIDSITELNFFKNSYLFVDFFFILSGFVLTHGYAFKQNNSYKSFFISRTFRIMPLHLFMLLLFIIFEFAKLVAYNKGISFNNVPFSNNTSPTDILPNIFLLQSWLPFAKAGSWNVPAWSISVEYYIYMLFFITLLVKRFQNLIWLTIISISLFLLITNNEIISSGILRGLSGFFIGIYVYLFYLYTSQFMEKLNIYIYIILEFCLVLLAIVFLSQNEDKMSPFLIKVVFIGLVYIFAFEKGFVSSILKKSLFQLLGKLSYSIYLTHTLVIIILTSIVIIIEKFLSIQLTTRIEHYRFFDFGNIIVNNIFVILFVVLVIFISMFTYKYIEKKGMEFGKKINSK